MKTLARPVALDTIKADARLATMALVRQPRLAAMPVTPVQFHIIVEEDTAGSAT
ncbi:MAG: EVE domain-containing protein [Verrucomicrobia bacterium]|nr:EVE domain-containing protein [Verrucomicrobiota bacterium]